LAVLVGVLTLVLAAGYVPLAWPARDVGDSWQVLFGFLAETVPES
jgi:hypothetical protein